MNDKNKESTKEAIVNLEINKENRFQLYYTDMENHLQCLDIEMSENIINTLANNRVSGIIPKLLPILKDRIFCPITIKIENGNQDEDAIMAIVIDSFKKLYNK